jgi:hypothetical protein
LPDNESVTRHGEFCERRAGLRSMGFRHGNDDQRGHDRKDVPDYIALNMAQGNSRFVAYI